MYLRCQLIFTYVMPCVRNVKSEGAVRQLHWQAITWDGSRPIFWITTQNDGKGQLLRKHLKR
jgi:hypothetical protein